MSAESPPKHRIKVAVLVGSLEIGGAELDIVRNFPRLNRDEFEVVVVSFGMRGALASALEQQGIPVIARGVGAPEMARSMIARRIRGAFYAARVIPWIARTLRRQRVDVVHFYLPHSYGYGMFACALMRPRPRRVMSRLSLNFYRDTHKTLSWLERHLFHRRVDIAIGNSEKILDELVEEGVPRERVRLLYNGVDPAPFAKDEGDRAAAREALDLEQDAFVILAVGNLHAYKGHRDLIEACSRASGSLPDRWHLLIAGRDEAGNKAVYVALAEKLGLADRVSLLGSVDNVPQLLFAGDVFVQPSHHEGLPNAVLEAMAASLPVIGTDVGGIPEVVNPAGSAEETGWLVPPHDIASLTAALLQAAANPDRLTSMGRSARRRVESEFSLDESVSAYEAIYRELMVSVGR